MNKIKHKNNTYRNLMLKIQYDGSGYNGWQRLASTSKTIQGTLEQYLFEILKEEITITGSGRTDTGVHAIEQTANFHTISNITIEELREQMNRLLPRDIFIRSIIEVDKNFHSRYRAVSKTYEYRIEIGERQSVFTSKHCYFLNPTLDIKSMETAAGFLVGEHDFKGFSTDRKDGKSTVRTIYGIHIFKAKNTTHHRSIDEICIRINGNGFLYNMVRIIVGTLIEVGEGKRKPESIHSILNSKNRELAGMTAIPEGLYLLEVRYPIPNY